MKYDFAHPRFRNGMVTFDEKKPDLLYEFRKAAAFHRYDVRNGILYSPDKKQIATVYNRFDSVFIHMLENKKIYRLSSKKDIDLFFNDLRESFNGDNNMKLDEAKSILENANYIVENTEFLYQKLEPRDKGDALVYLMDDVDDAIDELVKIINKKDIEIKDLKEEIVDLRYEVKDLEQQVKELEWDR